MASGANDRRGFVQRIREARGAYRGPFSGEHVRQVVDAAGYSPMNDGEERAFVMFMKSGRKPVPINPSWQSIYCDDPVFNCLRRDLGLSRGTLRTRLNQARQGKPLT